MVGRKYVYQFIMWLYDHNNAINYKLNKEKSTIEYGLDKKLISTYHRNMSLCLQLESKFLPKLRRRIKIYKN